MDFVVGVVSSIVTAAAAYTTSTIKNHFKYLCNHENQVRTLKNQVESLKDARERVQHSVDTAKGNGEEIEHDVYTWLTTVNKKIAEEVEKVMQDEEKAKKKCFLGLCPSFWTRYKLSVDAEEEAKAVAELLKQGKFDRVSYRAVPQGTTVASVKDFEAFESRTLVFNGIMEALKEPSFSIVGVHGMGGVGKTTLVKEVARQVKEGKLFDSVVIATVTQTLDVKDIQNQVAELLGLKVEEQSRVGRAHRLRERLQKEKKILVVLDDIWERLDLEEVGIPFGNEHEGCKILLTSRHLDVLSSGMETQKNFAVGLLNENEAWDLFKKMAGDCVESCDLQPTAIKVAKKCAGLPIAIATVARALRNKRLFEWENALRELKWPSSRSKGITAGVYLPIELSYNYLEDEEVKIPFLLCSLIGHNGSVECLLSYIMGLGSFRGINTIKEARNKVLTVVSKLKASCLLLDSYNDEQFDIHDVVRDVAISIASRDHHMFVLRDGDVQKEWPDQERMKNCSVIFLSSPNISELPDELKCSHLSFFFMNNEGSVHIPANFFRGTERLKVLHLARMQFQSLPVSINLLTNLHTLRLNRCALEDITIIGKLKKLEILSLAGSDIKALPREIAQLTRLRLLDLSHCTKLKIIPPNILSNLSKLEELYLEDSFVRWDDEVLGSERRNASLEELKRLSYLTTLYTGIPNAQIIPECLFSETLDRYKIFIGDGAWDWDDEYECSRTLRFKLDTSIYLDHGVKMLLKKTEDLYLDELEGIKNVVAELNIGEDFPHLKKLHIQNGLEVQYIATEKTQFSQLQSMTLQDLPQLISFCSEDKMSSTSQQEQGNTSTKPLFNKQIVFPQLTSLRLSSIKTQRIWHSQLSETYCFCLPNLKTIIIKGCHYLQHLLFPSVARNLVHLEQLEMVNCKSLREIIFTGKITEQEDLICFPQLNSLKIKNLPNLIKCCSGNYNIGFPSLKVLQIEHCPKLQEFISETKMEGKYESSIQALFNEKAAVPSLERMTLRRLRNVKKIFHDQLLAGSFGKLAEMNVECCDELLALFPSNVFGVLQSLKTLTVARCDSLEQMFEVGVAGLNIKEIHAVDSQLMELYIYNLPKLKHVWNKDPQGSLTFRNLRKVSVWSCESLKYLFPASIAKDLPQLEYLSISRCGVEEIVSAGDGLEQPVRFKFPRVSSLSLANLTELKCFYPGQHTILWPMLKKLETACSTLIKIIIASEGFSIHDRREFIKGQSLFLGEEVIPKLEELRLSKMDDIAMISDAQFPADFFHHIKVFEVGGSNFPIFLVQKLHNLENLKFSLCDFENLVFCEGDVGEKPDAGILSRIRKLNLNSCTNLRYIWKKDSELGHILSNLETLEVVWCDDSIFFGPSSASFRNLTTFEVQWCEKMIYLFPPSVVQSLVQLTKMTIQYCERMTAIVANEGDESEITFSKLKYLELNLLRSLESFCQRNHTFTFPSLEDLIVNSCTSLKVFSQGVLSTPQLERVKESGYDNKGRWAGDLNTTIQQLYTEKAGYHDRYNLELSDTFSELMETWNRNPQEILDLKNLGRLKVCNCSSLKYIFTPSMALSLQQLFRLEVKECPSVEAVIMEQGVDEEATTDKFTFPKLNDIEIESCSNLTSFYLGIRALKFPWLGTIRIVDCQKMTTFAASSYSRDKAKETGGDGSEKGDITATFFSDKVVCPKLGFLELSSINIQKIWHIQQLASSYHVYNLTRITIQGCHNLKYLFPSFMVKHFVQLCSLSILDCKSMEEVIIMEGLTEEEKMSNIMFPTLVFLVLEDLPKLRRFCYETNNEFPFLESLNLINCPVLKTFISKSMIDEVGDEPQIDQNAQGNSSALFNEKVVFPELKTLTIKAMRDCRRIWQDQLTVNSFCKLKNIWVEGCEALLSVFPFNMMERLEELNKLQIVNCDSLGEIFEPQALIANRSHAITTTQSIVVETEAKFVFPQVTDLRLEKLPKLKSFYSKILATEWPSLKKMEVIECHEVEIFAAECPCFGETHTESQVKISNQQPLFWIDEITFPILEELRLKQNDTVKGTWHSQVLSTKCFKKLKVLELMCIPEKSTVLPYCFIQSLPNLEKLVLSDASFCQIFQSEELRDEERHALTLTRLSELRLSKLPELTRLSELRLSKLPELTRLWEKECQPIPIFCNLRILEVLECGKLKTLVPSLVSLENLTNLEVSRCHGFINLIPCSTAKSLMLLERMSITDCEIIEEIIACGGDEMEGDIVFTRLKYLQLSCLPSLASFCLGDHNFEFPVLRKVIVRECPKMKIFCQGDLSTPKLKQVQLTEEEEKGRWEGDLKTTIKQLLEEMNAGNSEVTEVTN